MRLLYISRACRPDAGGLERLSYELLTALQQQSGVSVTPLLHTGSRSLSPLFALLMIPRALWLARHADVIHLGDPLLSLMGWLIHGLWRKPVVVMVHGLDVTYPHPLYRLYLWLFFRSFATYLPISTHAAALLKHWRVRGAVSVVRPGVTDRYFDSTISRAALTGLLGRDVTDLFVLLTVGRLVTRKGQAWFIEHVLPQLAPHTLYVIAGSGPAEPAIRAAATRAGVADRVVLLGRVSEPTLRILYNTVDAFVQPNIPVTGDAEGFGLVLLEAALCQRPVVAARLEGIVDAIHEGHNGILVPAGEATAWVRILQALPTSVPLSRSRDYTLHTFSWSRQIEIYLAAVRQLVNYV